MTRSRQPLSGVAAPATAQPLCPLCEGPNACVPAACGHLDAPCWCRDATFTPALLARVPPAQRGVACVCAACAKAGAWEGAGSVPGPAP